MKRARGTKQQERRARRTDEIMASLNEERENRKSNLVASLPDGDVWLHTCVLSSMLGGTIDRGWLKDSGIPGVLRLEFGEAFERSVIKHVVDYFYTGAIDESVPLDVCLRVLCAAHYFGAAMVEDLSAFIEKIMTPADAVRVYVVASRLHIALATSAMRLIGRNVESLSSASFKLVAPDLSHVLCEHAVYCAAVRYTEATGDFSVLLHVNFDALRREGAAFTKIDAWPAPILRHMLAGSENPYPKRAYSLSDCVVAISAHGGAWLFDMRTQSRYQLPSLFPPEAEPPEPISRTFGVPAPCRHDKGLSALLVDGNVCVFFLDSSQHRGVHVLKDGRWVFAGTTRYRVSYSAAAVFGSFVTLLGGGWDVQGTESNCALCERLVPGSSDWISRTALPTARRGSRAVTVGGTLYVSGGEDSEVFSDVLRFDVSTASFVPAGEMMRARRGHAVAVVGHDIYFAGGERDADDPAFEVLDTRTATSRLLPAPPCGTSYSYHSAFTRENCIFAIGGNYVDRFSIADGTWSTFSRSFPGGVAAVYVP